MVYARPPFSLRPSRRPLPAWAWCAAGIGTAIVLVWLTVELLVVLGALAPAIGALL